MEKPEVTRINLNMPNDLLVKVDGYANRMNVNRTSAICVLLNMALDSQKAVSDIAELLKIIQNEQNMKL